MKLFEVWKFLAGLGFFLYGMNLLEQVLKNLSGRTLKLYLKRNTKSLFKSILGGALITGIVQSSSVVSLMVLAFVESGIISFQNALGVILGANLGTTLDSWLVASIGFKSAFTDFVFPIIAVSAIGMFFLEKRKNLYNLLAVFFSLGILFLGLGYMKEGALTFVEALDLKAYTMYGTFVFVIIGFVLTTIIQSSSATVAITLTAIYAGVLSFPLAASVVIGSEVGTTIKVLLWGLKGSADKKRVAWGTFIYNIFTATIAFLLLKWLIYFIEKIVQVHDPLIGLVLFQSIINLISIAFFVPFLKTLSKWLQSRFLDSKAGNNMVWDTDNPTLPLIAVDSFRSNSIALFQNVRTFNKSILRAEKHIESGFIENIRSLTQTEANLQDEYEQLKQTEGFLLAYFSDINENKPSKFELAAFLKYIDGIRHAILSAKSIKDVYHDLLEFENSTNDYIHQQRHELDNSWLLFDEQIGKIMEMSSYEKITSACEQMLIDAKREEETSKSKIISQIKNDCYSELESSTLLNAHKELYLGKKLLIQALNEISMEPQFASSFRSHWFKIS